MASTQALVESFDQLRELFLQLANLVRKQRAMVTALTAEVAKMEEQRAQVQTELDKAVALTAVVQGLNDEMQALVDDAAAQ